MRRFGLLGKNISYSFSESYFKKKFENEQINDANYQNFDIQNITEFSNIISKTVNLKGLNVTIPYKEEVIPFLDKLNKKAKKIGAVNTIKINANGKLIGYNTDCYGFKKSLQPFLKPNHKKAIILGTGGASKAVAFTLNELGIDYIYISRKPSEFTKITYRNLTEDLIKTHPIIINCSPVGTFPNVDQCPNIPYKFITQNHILYDLIYNPEETKFLKLGKQYGATTINGSNMLILQAEKAWNIWNKD
ncbi:shikimate dehydrogenase [Yeosuana sp. MJ-SS3]|uniref:Shikimate dehydrogenase n=1 Tax=Gilvirhabdus luticola TaxID=3079858 RepID=A0ABU3U859_9FLAO|nr:shikimate dehydrogenase [Yeosuana sp. MJ-SS3]MDU8886592.1 shikimate dehydrogenase [Yeosuana sp. MJ-SS3]